MTIIFSLRDKDGNVKLGKNDYENELKPLQATGDQLVHLASQLVTVQPGDYFEVEVSEVPCYLFVKLDATLPEAMIYLTEKTWRYTPNFSATGREAMADTSFVAKRNYYHVRKARPDESQRYMNVSFNPYDQKEETGAYPHSYANVETRDDATFFAKNVIDGIYANQSHGSYPYQSWGINRKDDAELTIDFGREVEINQIGLTLRCDFPHDTYWKEARITVDGGLSHTLSLVKQTEPQYHTIPSVKTRKVTLSHLIRSEEYDSPFPALTQIDILGQSK